MLGVVKVVQLGNGSGNRREGERKWLSVKDKEDRKNLGSTKLKGPQTHQSPQLHVDLIYI